MVRAHGVEHTPKDWIVRAAATGEIRLLQYLAAKGVDVNTRSRSGQSPLGAAAAAGQIDIVKILSEHGADTEARDVLGFTALDWGEINGNVELVELVRTQQGP